MGGEILSGHTVQPYHTIPRLSHELISLQELPEKLSGVEARPTQPAVQGTVARSGKVLLLTLDAREQERAR